MTNNDILARGMKSLGVMSENTITGRGLRRFINDIVRCKDCKHYLKTISERKDVCGMACLNIKDENHFCGYGERESGEPNQQQQ